MLTTVSLASNKIETYALSPIEKQIVSYIYQKQDEQLLLLKKLVNINSGTSHFSGIYQVGNILNQEFIQLGFKTEWLKQPAHMKRAGTLIAEHPGKKGKKILLIGHLDTVFPETSPFQQFKQIGNLITGPGVIDDKGGDVILLYALKALANANLLQDMNITIVLTGDEEDSGKPTVISRKPLFDAAKNSAVALDFEWAITLNSASIARRGITNWLLETKGNEAHSSEIFQKEIGDGAIFEINRILNEMYTKLHREKYLTFNPGLILGGTQLNYDKNNSQGTVSGKGNVVAKVAMAKGDLRFLTVKQKLAAEKTILSIVNQHLSGTAATITFQDGIPSMPPTANNLALLEKYSAISVDLGYGPIKPLDPGLRGAGDISYVAATVPANLVGLGAVGTGAHSMKETLDANSLPIQTNRAALLIYRLTSNEK